MKIRRKIAATAATMALAGAGLVVGSGSAWAGTNGQQLQLDDSSGMAHSVSVSGDDQNGDWVTGCFNVSPGQSTPLNDWWWKGTVHYSVSSQDNCPGAYFYGGSINVSTYQDYSDYQVISD